MADKRNPSDPAGPGGRPPKRPRTIDLEATDVTAEAASASSASASGGPEDDFIPSRKASASGGLKSTLGAAAVGAVAMLVVLAVFWFAGFIGSSPNGLSDRLAGIESQLNDLSGRPTPVRTGNNAKAIEELTARVDRMEKSFSLPPSPLNDAALANRLASAENATKTFADNIGSLNSRVDDLASAVRELRTRVEAVTPIDKSEFDAMSNRIAALEKAAGLMESELGKRATVSSSRAVQLALATSALRAQVERGEPFAGELAAARPLAPDNAFAAIEPFAATGVPAAAALGRELLALVPTLRNAASAAPSESGFFDRLKSSASRLVRIRPVDDTASDDPAAVINRVESDAARFDIAGALDDLAKLPEPVRAPALAWIEKAQARNKAIAMSRQLAAEAIGALGKTTP